MDIFSGGQLKGRGWDWLPFGTPPPYKSTL